MTRGEAGLDDELDQLYAEPPRGFVAARNALADRLREAGDGESAARVRKLKKPSLPAWAVNEAIRESPAEAKEVLAAAGRLAAAQQGAGGKGAGSELREAMGAQHDAVEAMMGPVETALRGAGRDSAAMVDRARNTLRAVATDDELRAEFEAGRVRADREPVGFGSAAALGAGAKRPAKAASARSQAARRAKQRRAREAEKALVAAGKRLERRRDRLEAAERTLDSARQQLQQAEDEEQRAAAALEAARGELEG